MEFHNTTKRTVAIFGGSHFQDTDSEYQIAEKLSARIASRGWRVKTGGYYGIMEAASKGCFELGGESIGVTMETFDPKPPNEFLTFRSHQADIFDRIRSLIDEVDAILVFDGGLGTLAEFSLSWMLSQVGALRQSIPIIVVGSIFNDLSATLSSALHLKLIDRNLIKFSSNTDEIIDILEASFSENKILSKFSTTIGIAAYKAESTIRETVESINRQTEAPYEVIIVNDGSTDSTVDVAKSQAKGSRWRFIDQNNTGTSGALNKLISNCRTPYLLIVDSDDLLEPDALESLSNSAHANPKSAIIYSDHYCIDAVGKIQGIRTSVKPSDVLNSLELLHSNIAIDNTDNFMRVGHARLYRTECLREIGGFAPDLKYAEDYDLVLRCASKWQFQHVPKPLYHYRWHPENKSSLFRPEQVADVREAYRRHAWRCAEGRQ